MLGRPFTTLATSLTAALLLAPGAASAQVRYLIPGNEGSYNGPIYGASAYGGAYPVYPPGLINNPTINNPYYFREPVLPVLYGLGAPTGLPGLQGSPNFYRPLTGFTGTGPYASPLYASGVPAFTAPYDSPIYTKGVPIFDPRELRPGLDLNTTLLLLRNADYDPARGRAPRPKDKTEKQAGDRAAYIVVGVPTADAEIWFQGQKTRRTGKVREFKSPPLAPGMSYTYAIRARWRENGQEVTQTRTVPVRAGQHVRVDFPVTKD
jgi:uncharacterized protein (TIGR03000 family)